MSRRMACSMTVDAVLDETKTVTRRHVDTWQTLKVGDRLTLIEKGMGLKKGEKQRVLALVEITDVRVESIGAVHHCFAGGTPCTYEVRREGFPNMDPDEFITMWLLAHGYTHGEAIAANRVSIQCRRIEWRYL